MNVNRFLSDEERDLIQTHVYDLNNLRNCMEQTGIHNETLKGIMDRGNGKDSTINRVVLFAKAVKAAGEGFKTEEA